MHFYVRMVYLPGEVQIFLRNVLFMSVFHDCAVSDGNVYVIKISKYVAFIQPSWYYISVFGIWGRAGSVYVLWVCAEHTAGD